MQSKSLDRFMKMCSIFNRGDPAYQQRGCADKGITSSRRSRRLIKRLLKNGPQFRHNLPTANTSALSDRTLGLTMADE
jgi:hypothetical protein